MTLAEGPMLSCTFNVDRGARPFSPNFVVVQMAVLWIFLAESFEFLFIPRDVYTLTRI